MPAREELVMAARSGDRQAFADLIEAESPGAYRTVLVILHSHAEAQDALQEAFIRAWRDLPSLRDPSRWSAWFRRLLVRAALDQARRERGLGLLSSRLTPGPPPPDPASTVAARDEVARAVAKLSPDERALIALRYAADLEVPDVAAALGIRLGTAKSRLHRALARLGIELGEHR
jgi:RNA polymerase sigma-70 factor (ECF subfamily)